MSFLPKILAGEHYSYWKHAVPSQSLMHGCVTLGVEHYNKHSNLLGFPIT